MNKKIISFCATFLFLTAAIFAQVSIDPNDRFYADAKNWETKGIVSWLPQLRPYSVSTVKNILETVKENGDEDDKKLAEFYEKKFFAKPFNLSLKVADEAKLASSKSTETSSKNLFYVEPLISGDVQLFPLVGLGYKLGILAQNKGTSLQSVLPEYYYTKTDIHDDPMTIGDIITNIDMTTNLTVGTKNAYGMFGITKLAYGPFIGDSVMLNGSQFHTGNLSFVYEGEKWGYTQVFSALSRATLDERSTFMGAFANEKFFAFHSIRWSPIKQIALTYFESSVYSQRFDPLYFLPVPYMTLQCLYAASDNLINGLTLDFRPIDRLGISICGTIDDVDLNSFAKLDFGARFKFGVQAGINYVPPIKVIDNISLDYTIVAPYTYSHCDPAFNFGHHKDDLLTHWDTIKSYYNKENYTTRLTNLGTRLPPNSDRIQLKTTLSPVDRLRIDVCANFIRHANVAESFSDEEANQYLEINKTFDEVNSNYQVSSDGSAFTSPISLPSSERNDFMKQDHKMYVVQAGFDAEYELERHKWGTVAFNFGYMFEYVHNKGVDSHIYGSDAAKAGLTPEQARQKWISRFYDVVNNYFSVSVKYCY